MAPLEVLEPQLQDPPTGGFSARSSDGEGEMAGAPASTPPAPKKPPVRVLNVITHFMKGDSELELSLKVKIKPEWDELSVREAVVEPFVAAYDKKHPEYLASAMGPYTRVKVLVWGGPKYCAADRYREKDRDGYEDIMQAEKPIWCLLDVEEPISVLRKRAHNKLKPKIEIELVAAESTAIVVRGVPSNTLLAPGEQLIALLSDTDSDPEDMHAIVDEVDPFEIEPVLKGGELAYLGLTTARDREGKTCLHNAVTRGDLTLCRKLLQRREDVHAMDTNRNTAMHIACLAGRQLIVKDLLELGGLIHEKNRDLMNPLQLACVDEAQGNGEVVRMLVEAGADIDARCWDVTPLMAACSGGHHWAIETLLELGADAMIRNGYEMMAMDYCRDPVTSQIVYDFMRGFFLPDPHYLKRQAESRERRRQNTFCPPGMTEGPDDNKGPRLFQASRVMPLPKAFEALNLPMEWVDEFKKTGEHYTRVRQKWRQVVLLHHPDRLPSNLTTEAQEEHTAEFAKAMSAFEAIDSFYTAHHAPKAPAMGPDPGSAPVAPTTDMEPEGSGSKATPGGNSTIDTTPLAASATEDVEGSGDAGAKQDSKSRTSTQLSSKANAARERALRPLLYKRRVRIVGLQAKPEYNGKFGRATKFDMTQKRYAVELEGVSHCLKVRETNLEPVAEVEELEEGQAELVAVD